MGNDCCSDIHQRGAWWIFPFNEEQSPFLQMCSPAIWLWYEQRFQGGHSNKLEFANTSCEQDHTSWHERGRKGLDDFN